MVRNKRSRDDSRPILDALGRLWRFRQRQSGKSENAQPKKRSIHAVTIAGDGIHEKCAINS
jgi:hypothetical protein